MKVINSYGRLRRPISNGVKKSIILMGILALGLILLAGCRQRPEEVELEKKELIPLEEMGEAAPTAVPVTGITSIGSITQTSIGQRVTLKATITSVRVFREAKGRTLKIGDGTESIDVVIWKNLYNQIPQRDSLVKGTKIQVSGEIGSYKERLQIKPRSPGDIQILGAAPLTPVTQMPIGEKVVAPPPQVSAKPELKKVDTDGDGIPDTYVLIQEKKPTARPAATSKKKPQAVSLDTVQVTDITSTGKDEFTLVINGSLVIKGFKKMSGQKGEWVAMPGYQTKEGKYKDLVYPITSQAREAINEAVLRGKKNPAAEGPIVVNEDKIKLYKSAYAGKTKAYGTMTINNSLVMKIKVLEGQYGPWVALPTKKGEDGRYYDVAYPITPEAIKIIKEAKEAILRKYQTIK